MATLSQRSHRMMRLTGLTIYPLKSGAGIELARCELVATGLRHDRRFMLVDPAGDFLTLRGYPRLVTVQASLLGPQAGPPDGVRFEVDGLDPLELPLAPTDTSPEQIEVQIWGSYVLATRVSATADAWFSGLLQRPARLVRFDEPVRRQVDARYARPGDSVHFADEFPLLVIGTASLSALSERRGESVPVSRFRPNLVVETSEPFIEDRWRQIRVGDISIDIVKPCARCVGVNVEPGSGRASKEPLATLAKFRTRDGKVFFGQNAIHRGVGVLSQGDPVEVVSLES